MTATINELEQIRYKKYIIKEIELEEYKNKDTIIKFLYEVPLQSMPAIVFANKFHIDDIEMNELMDYVICTNKYAKYYFPDFYNIVTNEYEGGITILGAKLVLTMLDDNNNWGIEQAAAYIMGEVFTYWHIEIDYKKQKDMEFIKLVNNMQSVQREPMYGYVYIIQSRKNIFKIGKSREPKERVKALQSMNDHKLEIIKTYKSLYYSELENIIHKKLNKFNTHGEWFKVDKIELLEIVDNIYDEFNNKHNSNNL